MGVFDKVKSWIQGDAQEPDADAPGMESDAALRSPTASSIGTTAPSKLVSWGDAVLFYTPAGMLVIGCLLTALSELIAGWAHLGYLMVVLSPVVYWLIRIERHLAELVALQRKRNARG